MLTREMMVRIHEIARELEGDYSARLALAFKLFANEKAFIKSVKNAISLANRNGLTEYVVVRETEKAMLVESEVACGKKNIDIQFWVPKSQVKNNVIPQWILSKVESERRVSFI